MRITYESMKTNSYQLTWFLADGERKAILGVPIPISVESEGTGYLVSEPVFSLYAPCKDVEEGIECIRTQLSMLWDAYVGCPESTLTSRALKVRKRLISIV
jgi:hypothetical protein